MDIQYKLITGTESSPIKVVVDAYATSATISWVYEAVIEQDFCYECSARKSQSQVIDLEPLECDEEDKETSGTISWKRFTIYYTVTQKGVECPCNKEESTTSKNVFIRSWVSPYEIYCNRETKQTALFYEYYKIIETCGVIQKNKVIILTLKSLTNVTVIILTLKSLTNVTVIILTLRNLTNAIAIILTF